MFSWRIILLPFAFLYDGVTRFRNFLYHKEKKKSVSFNLPIICVGNITAGGTGKTPHVEYLIQLLYQKYETVILSRGYGRKTKGFLSATPNVQPSDIGDEPYQIFQKNKSKTNVVVCESRVEAVPIIIDHFPKSNLIIMDDGFQHRSIKPYKNIVLCNYNRPFFKDYVLPAGNSREGKYALKRADVVIVTKCPPNISSQKKKFFREELKKIKPDIPVYFTKYQTEIPKNQQGQLLQETDIAVLSGIANNKHFQDQLTAYHILWKREFPDHYNYREVELKKMIQECKKKGAKALVTTEKDFVKIEKFLTNQEKNFIYYQPIGVAFLEQEDKFQSWLSNVLSKFQYE